MRGRGLVIACAAGALLLSHRDAFAHPPPLGITGFPGGFIHPAVVPAHLMLVLAIGMLMGQRMPRWGHTAPAASIVGLLVGLAVLRLGAAPGWTGEAVLLAAMIGGGLVAIACPLPESAGCALAAVGGLALGLDSPPEVLSLREADLMLLGTALGGSVLLLLVTEVARRLTRTWQRIGMRILGSWIAASAVLVLTLTLARAY